MQSEHEKYRDILLDQDLKNKLKIKYKFIENNNKKPSTKVIKAPIIFTFSSSLKNKLILKRKEL